MNLCHTVLIEVVLLIFNFPHLSFGKFKLERASITTNDFKLISQNLNSVGFLVKKLENFERIKEHDLVFMIDASNNVGPENFQYEVEFVQKVLTGFTVSRDFTQIAVLPFSSSVTSVRSEK